MNRDQEIPPTSLLVAVIAGDRKAAKRAMQDGVDVNIRDNRPVVGDQTTALHLAAVAGDHLLIRELIRFGAELNVQSGGGQTPLWFACNGGHDNAIRELLESGADHTIKDGEGYSPRDRVPKINTDALELMDDYIARRAGGQAVRRQID